jgi:hypothetical protein
MFIMNANHNGLLVRVCWALEGLRLDVAEAATGAKSALNSADVLLSLAPIGSPQSLRCTIACGGLEATGFPRPRCRRLSACRTAAAERLDLNDEAGAWCPRNFNAVRLF